MGGFHLLQFPRNPRLVSASSSFSSNGLSHFSSKHTHTHTSHLLIVCFNSGSVPSSSNQSGKGGPIIIELPLNQIRRPLMRTRSNDPHKVQELMDSIAQIGLQVPVRIFTSAPIILFKHPIL